MTDTKKTYEELEADVRRMLWIGHGCQGVYGDDGEMQCNNASLHGFLDFRRQPLDELKEKVQLSKFKMFQQLQELTAENQRLRQWIEKAHHLDGCVRRRATYPWKKKESVPCDCEKISLTETVTLKEAIKRARGGEAPTQLRGYA